MRLLSRFVATRCLKQYTLTKTHLCQTRYQHSNSLEVRLPGSSDLDEVEKQKALDDYNAGDMPTSAKHDRDVIDKSTNDARDLKPNSSTANINHSVLSNINSSSKTLNQEGVLQLITHDDLFTTSNKVDFQRLSQFIKEAYEKRPHEKESEKKDEAVDIDSLLSNYKSDDQRGGFLNEAAPSFQNRITVQSLDLDLRQKLYEKCEAALIPTLAVIGRLQSSPEVYQLYNSILKRVATDLKSAKKDQSLNDRFYLRDVFLESNMSGWSELHEDVIERVRAKSSADPLNIDFNIITLPIITNHVFKKLGYQLFNGQLAISLFNKLKVDIHLYTLCCNQQTYNEILRTIWVYNGNIDLFEFEKVYTEMKFLGYSGNFVTYNILKTVIDEYNALLNGNSIFNEYGSKVLTRDDNARITFLTKEFHKLQTRLNNQLMKQDKNLLKDFQI